MLNVWSALEGRERVGRACRPAAQGAAGLIEPARWRKRTASGQALAKAIRTRLAVSVTRAATFRSRSLMVVNSALARACALGMASRTARTSPVGGGVAALRHLHPCVDRARPRAGLQLARCAARSGRAYVKSQTHEGWRLEK